MGVQAWVCLVLSELLLGEGAMHGGVQVVLLERPHGSSRDRSAQVLTWSRHEGGLLEEGAVA